MSTFAPRDSLKIHPAAAALPMPAETDPVFQRVVSSICDLGRILEPLKVCRGCVVDGRVRMHGAQVAGLLDVPTEEVAEEEVQGILFHSLMARRHYTKSGLALLAAMMFPAVEKESLTRRLANLHPGSAPRPARPLAGWHGRTPEIRLGELAVMFGVCRRLFCSARDFLKKLDHERMPAELRGQWVRRILDGEQSIEQAQQAISGKIAAIEGKTRASDAQLLFAFVSHGAERLGLYETLSKADRERFERDFREHLLPALNDRLWAVIEEYRRERKGP